MIDVGNAAGLDKPADLLQGTATNHHRGCNNEIDVDQGGKDGPDWIVFGLPFREARARSERRRSPSRPSVPPSRKREPRLGPRTGGVRSSSFVAGHVSSPSRTAKNGLFALATANA